VADCGARAAAGDARHWVHELTVAGGLGASARSVSSRPEKGGFIDGENVAIAFRWARGDYSRLPTLATDLVSRRVNVISALGGPSSALAAKRATSTIPIVTSLSADTTGLVESFNRPGGNVTASQSRPI
jgi:putative ABC transport system substrate-binding protein